MKQKQIKKIFLEDSAYPFLLKQISDPPKVLYVLGDLPENEMPYIAVVGTRKATPEGRLIAKTLAKNLSQAGCIIVSGLALGIDTASHEGTVAGQGKTIAVLGSGLSKIYPRHNENLAEQILELGGAIISEYPPEEPAYPSNFLARNRIISGLSRAVVIVEAPKRSGSLATARLALEQNREIFVVPGPISHSNYIGSHLLIREGARLIVSAEDILEDLNLKPFVQMPLLNREEELILTVLRQNHHSLSVDKIQEMTKLDSLTVNKTLTFLLLKNIIEEGLVGYKIKI